LRRRAQQASFVLAWTAGLILAALLIPGARPRDALAQQQGIQVVGATNTAPLGLTHGCNMLIIQTQSGTPVAAIAALVAPAAALQSIWRYNNAQGLYQVGYFADPGAPVTFSTTGTGKLGTATETYLLCVNQAAEILPI